jgi:hypothetical protein
MVLGTTFANLKGFFYILGNVGFLDFCELWGLFVKKLDGRYIFPKA